MALGEDIETAAPATAPINIEAGSSPATPAPAAAPSGDRPKDKQITLRHRNPTIRAASVGVFVTLGDGPVSKSVEIKDNKVILEFGAEGEAIRDVLIRDGFIDETWYARESKHIVVPSKPRAVYWYFSHPERSRENQMNGTIGLHTSNGPVSIDMHDGQIQTDSLEVHDALVKSGFIMEKAEYETPKN